MAWIELEAPLEIMFVPVPRDVAQMLPVVIPQVRIEKKARKGLHTYVPYLNPTPIPESCFPV